MEAFIGVGTNLGDRRNNIQAALSLMEENIKIESVSGIIRTPPREGAAGGYFLNCVVKGSTRLSPLKLMKFLLEIEKKMGRVSDHPRLQARVIDLDILFLGSRHLRRQGLVVPHPAIQRRDFVLSGLAEIAPDFMHPLIKKTMRALWRELTDGNSEE